ncbi:MAG: tRNA guanosine(34) transglycosylase Tgt [Acidobacteriaceae bacterium]|jgi:queuine tRNA-ribosyltransferase
MVRRFEVGAASQSGGRRGALHLPHGAVQTPVFMPVGTAATVKAVQQATLEQIGANGAGAELILANTYHLTLRPGHELIRRMGGVHRFMSWSRPMLTDSGGFQVFSLARLRKVTDEGVEFRSHLDGSLHFFSPEHSMEVQIALGADVTMAFDECVETPATWQRTRDSMGLTHAWAMRSKEYFEAHRNEVPWAEEFTGRTQSLVRRTQCLFGIVQGGMYTDLRRESAERLVEMEFDGYAIGGLAVGEPPEVTREMIARTLEILPRDRPRYVMGVGYPDQIAEYARMGVDMMDCVLPTRAARHGLLFRRAEPGEESSGSGCPIHASSIGVGGVEADDSAEAETASRTAIRMNIKRVEYAEDQRPIDPACACPVCQRYTRAYLRHLFMAREPLGATLNSIHNLAFYLDIMERVRAEFTRL